MLADQRKNYLKCAVQYDSVHKEYTNDAVFLIEFVYCCC